MPLLFIRTTDDDMIALLGEAGGQMSVGPYGQVGGAWQKQPLQFGYSATVERTINNTNLTAGNSTQQDTAVPAGEIWRITNISTRYIGTVAGVILRISVLRGGTSYIVQEFRTLTSGQYYTWSGEIMMKEGDQLEVSVNGATLNDDLYTYALGIRVDIDL